MRRYPDRTANLYRGLSMGQPGSYTRPDLAFGPHFWELFWCFTATYVCDQDMRNSRYISRRGIQQRQTDPQEDR